MKILMPFLVCLQMSWLLNDFHPICGAIQSCHGQSFEAPTARLSLFIKVFFNSALHFSLFNFYHTLRNEFKIDMSYESEKLKRIFPITMLDSVSFTAPHKHCHGECEWNSASPSELVSIVQTAQTLLILSSAVVTMLLVIEMCSIRSRTDTLLIRTFSLCLFIFVMLQDIKFICVSLWKGEAQVCRLPRNDSRTQQLFEKLF
jgi:hypothetical protein